MKSNSFNLFKGKFMVKTIGALKKTDVLGSAIDEYPEVAPILAQAGLHCIGCHVSAYETIEQGCLAHGMSNKDVDEMVSSANKRISLYESMPPVGFTPKSVAELDKRLGKPKKKFMRIVQAFGEFDFEASNKKEKDEVVLSTGVKGKKVDVLASKRVERMLRGVKIDYDVKKKDFIAKRT